MVRSASFISLPKFTLQFGINMIRDMCSTPAKSVLALCLIMFLCRSCKASDSNESQNCSSLCGDHNISSPFRLKHFPKQCGDMRYELSCEKNQLFLYWKSEKYIVLSINYDNYAIRVRDGNIVELNSSSLPIYSSTNFHHSQRDPYSPIIYSRYEDGIYYYHELNTNVIYIRCEHSVHSPMFVDTSTCFNTSNVSLYYPSPSPSPPPPASSSSSYYYVESGYVEGVGLEGDCFMEGMYMTSWPALKNQPWSCTEIHNSILYGFDLSWLKSFCPDSKHDYEIILGDKEPRCERVAISISIFRKILCIIPVFLDFFSISELGFMMIVGFWCIQVEPNDDPPMNKVEEILEGNERDLEMLLQPYLYQQDIPNVEVSNLSSSILLPSDMLASDNEETTSFSTQQDGISEDTTTNYA